MNNVDELLEEVRFELVKKGVEEEIEIQSLEKKKKSKKRTPGLNPGEGERKKERKKRLVLYNFREEV